MKLVQLKYRIATLDGWNGVTGYAIQLPRPFSALRFCIRQRCGAWTIDHYDTGLAFGGPVISVWETSKKTIACMRRWSCPTGNRRAVLRWLIRYLRHMQQTDKLRNSHHRIWRRCLKEAGL